MGLSEVMSLEELFCPLGGNRERISANVRGLRGACRNGGAAPSGKWVGAVRALEEVHVMLSDCFFLWLEGQRLTALPKLLQYE